MPADIAAVAVGRAARPKALRANSSSPAVKIGGASGNSIAIYSVIRMAGSPAKRCVEGKPEMRGRVEGKIALVTGAGSGLGRADAVRLAQEGATVVVTDRDMAGLQDTAQTIGAGAVVLQLDVTSEAEWIAVLQEVDRRFGRLDVLVNNAGVVRMGSIEQCSLEDWRLVNAVCAEGTFLGCKHALPLLARGGGSIINIASLAGLRGVPDVIAYSGAKGAIRAMSKSIAVHCGVRRNGVRCNSIYPGGMETPMAAAARGALSEAHAEKAVFTPIGQPSDVADAVVFLASDESRWINGAELVIDNGVTAAVGHFPD
jgi:3(or 17)beta-hydroxysteroid dehydrogenase